MYIFNKKRIINLNHAVTIDYAKDFNGYVVRACPGGDIVAVDTRDEAVKCLDILVEEMANGTKQVITTEYIMNHLKAKE